MLWLALLLNDREKVNVVPPGKPTGVSNSNAAAWFLPNCGSMAQAERGSASMAAAMGRPFCSKVARGFLSLMRVPSDLTAMFDGVHVTLKSDSAKLPLAARPGPPFTSDGSASASTRTAVMAAGRVDAVNVYTSNLSFLPVASNEPSSSFLKTAPSFETALDGSRMIHG